jgi:hypothetical protein
LKQAGRLRLLPFAHHLFISLLLRRISVPELTLTLRFLDVAATYADCPHALLLATDALKDDALLRLGIERPTGRTHLQAWILAMCSENGLPTRLPAIEIGEAVAHDRAISAFVWWLA